MRSAPYIGPAANFFVLNTRNYRWFVTHGILGMNIEGTSTLQNFRAYTPTPGGSFTIPPNSGQKPGFQKKKRNTRKIDIAVDRTENIPATEERCSSSNISFSDSCKQAGVEYVFQFRSKLPKAVSRCQGKCEKPINKDDVLLVMSYKKTYWTNLERIKQVEDENKDLDLCYFQI